MSLLNQSIIKHKVGLLNLAEELDNVSQACRLMGVSRDTFYRVKDAKETGGMDALLHKDRRRPNLKNRVDETIERAVLQFVLDNPAAGQFRARGARATRNTDARRRDALSARAVPGLDGLAPGHAVARLPTTRASARSAARRARRARRADAISQRRRRRGRGRACLPPRRPAEADRVEEGG